MLTLLQAPHLETESPADAFADFWLLYPKRVAKKEALKAWSKIGEGMHVEIFTALVAWRVVWRNKDVDYLPHPASWLNGERWDDELPQEYRQTHASHAPAKLPEAGERTQMPEHVKAYLAKLRGKA